MTPADERAMRTVLGLVAIGISILTAYAWLTQQALIEVLPW